MSPITSKTLTGSVTNLGRRDGGNLNFFLGVGTGRGVGRTPLSAMAKPSDTSQPSLETPETTSPPPAIPLPHSAPLPHALRSLRPTASLHSLKVKPPGLPKLTSQKSENDPKNQGRKYLVSDFTPLTNINIMEHSLEIFRKILNRGASLRY